MVRTIGIAGAGTMGSGIALVAAQHGFPVVVFDLSSNALQNAAGHILHDINHLVERKKVLPEEAALIFKRISFTTEAANCVADLFIEAIIENITAKLGLFAMLAAHNADNCILASNTSALSITKIQAGISHPERVVGMHFFNPAPAMKLVELIEGKQTSEATMAAVFELSKQWGKIPVRCTDSPGFIVNRVARHYYLQAMKMVTAGLVSIEQVDEVMEQAGFKMGPFRLMDLIGMDVNLSVSEHIYQAFGHAERFKPSTLQQQKVASGALGKKTGHGFYHYNS